MNFDPVLLPNPIYSIKLVVQCRDVFLALCYVLLDLCLVRLKKSLVFPQLVLKQALDFHLGAFHLVQDPITFPLEILLLLFEELNLRL